MEPGEELSKILVVFDVSATFNAINHSNHLEHESLEALCSNGYPTFSMLEPVGIGSGGEIEFETSDM